MDHYNHGPRGSEVPEAMLSLCIIIFTITNLQKARYLGRQPRTVATGKIEPAKEDA